jgi:peptidoglycan/LPS O-acetylase OafA/YrhL
LFYASALLTTLAIAVFLILLAQSETAVRLCRPLDFIGRRTLPYIAFQVPFMKLMWYYMPATFGTKAMPWLLIQTVILFFGMMPFAWAVDKIVPRRSKLKQAAGRKLASLPAGQRTGGEPVEF